MGFEENDFYLLSFSKFHASFHEFGTDAESLKPGRNGHFRQFQHPLPSGYQRSGAGRSAIDDSHEDLSAGVDDEFSRAVENLAIVSFDREILLDPFVIQRGKIWCVSLFEFHDLDVDVCFHFETLFAHHCARNMPTKVGTLNAKRVSK